MKSALEAGWATVLMTNPLWVVNTRCPHCPLAALLFTNRISAMGSQTLYVLQADYCCQESAGRVAELGCADCNGDCARGGMGGPVQWGGRSPGTLHQPIAAVLLVCAVHKAMGTHRCQAAPSLCCCFCNAVRWVRERLDNAACYRLEQKSPQAPVLRKDHPLVIFIIGKTMFSHACYCARQQSTTAAGRQTLQVANLPSAQGGPRSSICCLPADTLLMLLQPGCPKSRARWSRTRFRLCPHCE